LLKEGKISKDEMIESIYQVFNFSSQSLDPLKIEKISLKNEENFRNEENVLTLNSISFEGEILKNEPTFSYSNNDNFLERQSQWEVKKSLNHEQLREMKEKHEFRECTFQPKTNVSPSKFSQETIERLSKHRDLAGYTQSRQAKEQEKLLKELAICTFEPMINSVHADSRYLSQSPSKPRKAEEPSFAPQVKGALKNMKSVREYLKLDPFERLSKPQAEVSLKIESPEARSPKKDLNGQISKKSFFERQAFYELQKFEKRENLQVFNHQPVINERSKKMVKKTFDERNQEMIEKRKKPKKDPYVYSFRPKITRMAKLRKYRSFHEISSDRRKGEVIESPENRFDLKIPVKSFDGIKSKLQILNDPEGFIERLKNEQRRRDEEIMEMKEDRMRKELEECTYQPNVIDSPEYVKQIARNMALLKMELGKSKTPVKYDWR
jgi:hypothetical protein